MKWFHNKCELTFCPSDDTRRHLAEQGITRVEIMKRGVDGELFSPSYRNSEFRAKIGARNDSIVFTYVGRIAPEKNLDVLTESISEIKREYGDRVIYGTTSIPPPMPMVQIVMKK